MGSMWGSNVPLIGRSLTRWGKVGQVWATPCQASPELWVYAAWKGIAKAMWSIAKPTALGDHGSPLSQSVFGKHGRTSPKGSLGPRYRMNGELIPGPAFQWPGGEGWAMWQIPFQLVRAAGWYLLVFDALAEGAVAWSSEVYKYAGCADPTQPYFYGVSGPHLLFPGEFTEPGPYASGEAHGMVVIGGRANITAGASYTAALMVTSAPWGVLPNDFAPASGRILNNDTGQRWEAAPGQPGADGLHHTIAVARGTAGQTDVEELQFIVQAGAGFCIIDGTVTYLQGTLFDNILADP